MTDAYTDEERKTIDSPTPDFAAEELWIDEILDSVNDRRNCPISAYFEFLGLTARAYNFLHRMGIWSKAEALQFVLDGSLHPGRNECRGMGIKTYDNIREWLKLAKYDRSPTVFSGDYWTLTTRREAEKKRMAEYYQFPD